MQKYNDCVVQIAFSLRQEAMLVGGHSMARLSHKHTEENGRKKN